MSPTSGFLLEVPLEPVVILYRPAPPWALFVSIFFPFCVSVCTLMEASGRSECLFLTHPSSYFLGQGLLLNTELTDSARLADQ